MPAKHPLAKSISLAESHGGESIVASALKAKAKPADPTEKIKNIQSGSACLSTVARIASASIVCTGVGPASSMV